MRSRLKLSTLKRIFEVFESAKDITLNFGSSNPTDEEIMKSVKYPFGQLAFERGISWEDQKQMKEDFISMRSAIKDLEKENTVYSQLAILNDIPQVTQVQGKY